ncbi:OLC1v1008474C1 [Oldenlandia corymbosa var. corymbosa]|uniref:OLC1v1008474C1 n=1 Tax=Oldenlandia corymbosa var. corymbosa TaxID=529605 RepID=A0AAV1DLM7_OLDCO|nr:OLC1v1008474C1 [Oldenlandia corymbosa var. corymbosa]
METQVAEHVRGRGMNKRQWTVVEDSKLVEVLLDLAGNGQWKCDNGTFKDGFLTQIEKLLEDKMPRGAHPNARGLRNKPFPHYESLSLIFGKDRSNGEGAENAADTVDEQKPEWKRVRGDNLAIKLTGVTKQLKAIFGDANDHIAKLANCF